MYLCFLGLILSLSKLCTSTPFLYNSGGTIIRSLFSTSSGTQTDPNRHIEDLRVPKNDDKIYKNNLQHYENEEKEFIEKSENQEEIDNMATPDLVSKKIGKVLTKLQLISAVKNTLGVRPLIPPSNMSDDYPETNQNIVENSHDFDNSTEPISPVTEPNSKLDLSPSFGIYIMEMIASLGALLYGAALQIVNGVRPNPPPIQNICDHIFNVSVQCETTRLP